MKDSKIPKLITLISAIFLFGIQVGFAEPKMEREDELKCPAGSERQEGRSQVGDDLSIDGFYIVCIKPQGVLSRTEFKRRVGADSQGHLVEEAVPLHMAQDYDSNQFNGPMWLWNFETRKLIEKRVYKDGKRISTNSVIRDTAGNYVSEEVHDANDNMVDMIYSDKLTVEVLPTLQDSKKWQSPNICRSGTVRSRLWNDPENKVYWISCVKYVNGEEVEEGPQTRWYISTRHKKEELISKNGYPFGEVTVYNEDGTFKEKHIYKPKGK
jgi:hypothetical protein